MQWFDPRMAGWYRKGSVPKREEGREKRADRTEKREGRREQRGEGGEKREERRQKTDPKRPPEVPK